MTSLQPEKSEKEDIQTMYDQLCLTPDKELLKTLLFELSIATMTFKQKSAASMVPSNISNDIDEILIFYDNSEGNISLGIRRTDRRATQTTRFFPLIFRGLNNFFTGRVILYICFRAIFGCSISIEFLGSIPSVPSLLGDTLKGTMTRKLQNMVRFRILLYRAKSYMQTIGQFTLKCSAAHYAFHIFYPILIRSARGIEGIDCRKLLKLWLELKELHLLQYEEERHRLSFKPYFPEKVPLEKTDAKILRFLSYNTFQYFDSKF